MTNNQDLNSTRSSLARIRALVVGTFAVAALLSGCASTGNPKDPLEPINRGIYQFNDGLDQAVLRPTAEVYRDVLPQFVRSGISNFFSNINDVLVALNNLLQGKAGDAASDVGRIVINTTVGIFGFFDPASEMGLEKHNEDFGQTLGRWGIGDGPYLVLPIFGPSNLRDTVGRSVDYRTDPITYVDPSRDRNQFWALRAVNQRAELLSASNILETAALDPYEFLRDAYLQRRRSLVYDGNPPRDEELFDLKDEPRTEAPKNRTLPGVAQAPTLPESGPTGGDPRDQKPAAAVQPPPAAATVAVRAAPPAPKPARIVRFWAPVASTYR